MSNKLATLRRASDACRAAGLTWRNWTLSSEHDVTIAVYSEGDVFVGVVVATDEGLHQQRPWQKRDDKQWSRLVSAYTEARNV